MQRLLLCPATVYIHTINEYFLPQATAAADSGPEDPENQKMQRTARLARAPSPPTKTSDSRCEVGNSPTETFLRFLRRGLVYPCKVQRSCSSNATQVMTLGSWQLIGGQDSLWSCQEIGRGLLRVSRQFVRARNSSGSNYFTCQRQPVRTRTTC